MADLENKVNEKTGETPFFVEYARKAREEHLQFEPAFAPGFIAVKSDIDVKIDIYRKTIGKNYVLLFSEEEDVRTALLHFVKVEELNEVINDLENRVENGEIETETFFDEETGVTHTTTKSEQPISFNIELERVDMGEGNGLTVMEFLIWTAITAAEDEETKRRIFESAYQVERKPRRDRKRKYSSPTKEIKWPNDPVTIALMDRNEGHIEPSEYFGGERDINTGGGGSAKLTVSADESIEIDADESLYVLNNETFFWYSMLSSIALDTGKKEIYGTDILKLVGYQNPYRDDCAEVMQSAANNIYKAMRTTISVDTTNERRNKRRKNRELIESIGLRSVISADMDLTTEKITDDEGKETGEIVRDFVVTLKPRDGEIITAFPLYTYADSRDMVLTFGKGEYSFEGLRLSLDDRRMWMYVLRRVKSQKLSNTIKFETMWNTLELKPREYTPVPETDENGKELKDANGNVIYKQEDKKIIARKQSEAMRKKKERMIKQLEKMLYQAAGGLDSGQKMKKGEKPKYPRRIASWEWTKNKSTGKVDGVKITPLKSTT